jgi:hypothetical protein
MLSQKVIATIVITFLIVGGIIGVDVYKKIKDRRNTQEDTIVEKETKEEKENKDSLTSEDDDGDGLLNWEESLRKTDMKNPDTDGDGTNDGDEILLNRDPLKAGPDDSISFVKNNTDDEDNSSEEIFNTYTFTKGTLSEQVSTNLVSK